MTETLKLSPEQSKELQILTEGFEQEFGQEPDVETWTHVNGELRCELVSSTRSDTYIWSTNDLIWEHY